MEIDAIENGILTYMQKSLKRYNERLKKSLIITKAYLRWYDDNDEEYTVRPEKFKYCMIAVDFCKSDGSNELVIPLREFINFEKINSSAKYIEKKMSKDIFKYSRLIFKEGNVSAKAIFKKDLEHDGKRSFKDFLTKRNIIIFFVSVIIVILIIDILMRIFS